MIDKKLKMEIIEKIDHPISRVWAALTDKNMVRKYFFGTELETDWSPGSPITFTGSWDGNEYKDSGTILESEKEKLIKYNYLSSFSGLPDLPENYSIITYKLEPENNSTVLIVTQEGFNDQKACDDSYNGWKIVLDNMKKLLEE
ncbi:MAG: SRPBCC domain-containing protein [Melioribacteraceae bacterium]|nr:SRPBCC domain-containing protein [Melioribacteraceae bacterium]MCF8356428.1 SRPBCC domain-containing protein [Melioribacteraceae bacterium]MCF8395783.1 SRPBCC domain-containing protein [Melioribacteraceae bacterium]MCF8420912.1 SRPBCC domain-containing protein [Melioribacteraceae bacterium]